jgi:hypothetical protein
MELSDLCLDLKRSTCIEKLLLRAHSEINDESCRNVQ